MDTGPFFRTVNEPGLWMHERCVKIEREDAESILCSVVATSLAAAMSDFKTVMRELEETLREDMEKRADSESGKVTAGNDLEVAVKWLDAPEDWASMPPAARTRYVLRSIGYVRVQLDDAFADVVSGHWRRTLDRL